MSFKSTRRAFIGQGLSFTALKLAAPQFLTPQSQTPKILVIIELSGGNDGLNTVVPFTDSAYKRARPHIALPSQTLLLINDELALHPALRELADLYEAGQVAIINGVGYENSARTHFEAMDAWQSGEVKEDQKRSGWLGRYLNIAGDDSAGVVMGDQLPLLALASSGKVAWVAGEYDQTLPSLHALYQNHEFIAPEIMFADAKTPLTRVTYPQTELAQNLQATARLIADETKARVFYVRLDGFDTHENQPAIHAELLSTLSGAIGAFYRDLKEQGKDKDVLTLTFSEFGRSVSENSRGGTDHGAASCLFAIGGVHGGVYGAYPDLNDLENGALKPHVDFRRVYATVLEKWLGADSKQVLSGRFEMLNFV